MKFSVISFLMILLLFASVQLYSCTIFYVVNDNQVFAGNNEDWKDPYAKMWFYPAQENKYGWVKFGWGSGFPQGGMNDQGLFWDASACAFLEMPLSESKKEKHDGPLMQKVIEECATVEEALKVFAEFYCEDQYRAQYLIGDSTGKSIIVEGDNIIHIQDDFQVLTNFYHSHPEMGGYPCWRYETAVDMLSEADSLSAYFIGSVLAATHQEGKYPTQYSNIYDLKKRQFYLFHFHNYEEFISIDLGNELNNGYKTFDIPELFSRTALLNPIDGEKITTASVTLSWKGIESSSYEVIYSTDPNFSVQKSKRLNARRIHLSSIPPILFFLLVLFFILWVSKRKLTYPVLFILIFGLFFMQCKKDEPAPEEIQLVEMNETISDLEPGTTYYWKIRAQTADQSTFISETISRYFITDE